MKITGTDIIVGLEDAWNAIFNFSNAIVQDVIGIRGRTVSRVKAEQLYIRSLITLWAPLYDSFSGTRRSHWTAYWISLPFGSHVGGGGWPGSGFSAFIYTNAPRLKAGVALLYEPPTYYGNMILNGDFSAGSADWTGMFDGFYGSEAIFDNPGFLEQNVSFNWSGTRELSFDLSVRDKVTHALVPNAVDIQVRLSSFQSYDTFSVRTGRFFYNKSGSYGNGWSGITVGALPFEVGWTNVSVLQL